MSLTAHQVGLRHGDAPLRGGQAARRSVRAAPGPAPGALRLAPRRPSALRRWTSCCSKSCLAHSFSLNNSSARSKSAFMRARSALSWSTAACMVFDILVGGLQAGFGGGGIGFGGSQAGFLRIHVGLGLDILDPGQQLALADAVAFLDQEFGDIAHGVGADVDVILGLDFAGRGHQAGQILAHHRARLHGDHAALAVHRAGINAGPGHQDGPTVMRIFHLSFTTEFLPSLCQPYRRQTGTGVHFHSTRLCPFYRTYGEPRGLVGQTIAFCGLPTGSGLADDAKRSSVRPTPYAKKLPIWRNLA